MFNLTLIEISYVIKCHAFEEGKKWKLVILENQL